MQDYQLRVIEEKKELDEKIKKLVTFVESDTFKQINLEDQLSYMEEYSWILGKRIDAFIE